MAYLERLKVLDSSGNVINPVENESITEGELIEAIESLRMAIMSLTRTVGLAMPDTGGRLRVNVDSTTLGTLTTLTNQVNIGGFSGTEQIPSLMRIGCETLRRNIAVT